MERAEIDRLNLGVDIFEKIVVDYNYVEGWRGRPSPDRLPDEHEGIEDVTIVSCEYTDKDGNIVDGSDKLQQLIDDDQSVAWLLQEIILDPEEEC